MKHVSSPFLAELSKNATTIVYRNRIVCNHLSSLSSNVWTTTVVTCDTMVQLPQKRHQMDQFLQFLVLDPIGSTTELVIKMKFIHFSKWIFVDLMVETVVKEI